MKITRKEDYGVMVMCALAKEAPHTPVSLEILAERHHLPRAFVRQIARELMHANLLISKEGSGGGYMLSREPHQINLKEVLEAITGPTRLTQCTIDDSCKLEHICPTKKPWQKLHSVVNDVLSNITLTQLIQ